VLLQHGLFFVDGHVPTPSLTSMKQSYDRMIRVCMAGRMMLLCYSPSSQSSHLVCASAAGSVDDVPPRYESPRTLSVVSHLICC